MTDKKAAPIIIHGIDHARAALSVAAKLDVSLTLLSAPSAAAYLGSTVFRDIISEAHKDYPGVSVTAVLDCGDEPGMAMAAMRHGIKAVRISNPPEIRAKLADIADQRGVVVFEYDGPVLDLLDMTNPAAACLTWLAHPA